MNVSNYRHHDPIMLSYRDGEYDGTHTLWCGYLFWLIGFTGAHRFYYGKPLTGLLWFVTLGLLGVGWIVDLVLIPGMDREAFQRYEPGPVDYNVAWLCLMFLGLLGLHRFLQGKWLTGLLYLLTGGIVGLGVVYDVLTMNEQIDDAHRTPYTGNP